ncbi:MAG: DUF349 domain-containing protein [Bacteroidales bacterium]|nr:DUF349 domain-containing protein [Bacteroidales bacterium]
MDVKEKRTALSSGKNKKVLKEENTEKPENTGTAEEKKESASSEEVKKEKRARVKKEIQPQKPSEPQTDTDYDDEDEILKFEEEISPKSRVELVDILEKLINEEDLNSHKTRIGLIKVAYNKHYKEDNETELKIFIEKGGKKEEYQPLRDTTHESFKASFEKYKEKKALLNEQFEKEREKNLIEKKQILEELKALVGREETLKKTYDDFKTLQTRWREIGPVHPKETNDLWQTYHYYVEIFFDKVKINKELKDLDQKKNLKKKIAICEKIEALFLEDSIKNATLQFEKYQEEWREIGPVPNSKKDEIWERFKEAAKKFNKHRQEYYDKIKEEKEQNYLAKVALCEKVELLAEMDFHSARETEEKAKEIGEIQKAWKTIGFTPKKNNEDIWNRFKAANDLFFQNRHEFYQKNKEEKIQNLNLKIELCIQAEALQNNTEWRKTTEEFLKLQEEWKKIGPVPKKHSEKLWKRFRTSCDTFFNSKSNFFATMDERQENNLKLKKELLEKIENFTFDPAKTDECLKILKDFQAEWIEIGHVPINEKDNLNGRFKAAINKCYDNLKLDFSEKNLINFKTRFESIYGSPNGYKIIKQESIILSGKISTAKSEISIWENNIGFLSRAKSSEPLRKEFEEKISSGKEKIKLMEDKLKFLKKLMRPQTSS